jgi:hypothetical protein
MVATTSKSRSAQTHAPRGRSTDSVLEVVRRGWFVLRAVSAAAGRAGGTRAQLGLADVWPARAA